ncbi:MAG: hypothetical protein HKN18_11315 [Silicimonas sp.]|nr:hypothetical protein [Silicimonas sp.]
MAGNRPLNIFEKTNDRATALFDYAEAHARLPIADDLVRSGVVISVAGFDRYFTAKFCDVLVPYLKASTRVSEDILERLEEAGLSTEFALELLVSDRPFRKIRTIVQNSLSKHTTHRTDVIDKLFLGLALKDLCPNAQRRVGRRNMLRRIELIVDVRNDIAHSGPVNTRGNPKAIDVEEIRRKTLDMAIFIRACDSIIDNKFGVKPVVSA